MSPVIMHRQIQLTTIFLALSLLFTTTSFAQVKNTAPLAKPTLNIITPSDGQTIYGNKIPILFAVEDFELVDYNTNPTPVAGRGHVHLWLDDQNPTRESATKVPLDSFTFSDVDFGEHNLRAELVNNNHTSLTPPIVVTAKFKNAPVSSPSPPVATSGFDKNTALVILVVVALVIIAAWWYTKEEDEELEVKKSRSTKKKSSGTRRKTKS